MPGCCLVSMLLFFGARLVLAGAWLFSDWYDAFDARLPALLGWLFLPWTSLAWMYAHFTRGGDLGGGFLIVVLCGVLLDVGAFGLSRWSPWDDDE
ncbi:MAG: hypothetical protein AAFU73_14475 [Planctomycetota bacterium]